MWADRLIRLSSDRFLKNILGLHRFSTSLQDTQPCDEQKDRHTHRCQIIGDLGPVQEFTPIRPSGQIDWHTNVRRPLVLHHGRYLTETHWRLSIVRHFIRQTGGRINGAFSKISRQIGYRIRFKSGFLTLSGGSYATSIYRSRMGECRLVYHHFSAGIGLVSQLTSEERDSLSGEGPLLPMATAHHSLYPCTTIVDSRQCGDYRSSNSYSPH